MKLVNLCPRCIKFENMLCRFLVLKGQFYQGIQVGCSSCLNRPWPLFWLNIESEIPANLANFHVQNIQSIYPNWIISGGVLLIWHLHKEVQFYLQILFEITTAVKSKLVFTDCSLYWVLWTDQSFMFIRVQPYSKVNSFSVTIASV